MQATCLGLLRRDIEAPGRAILDERSFRGGAVSDGSGPLEESMAMDALEAPPRAASELSYASARSARCVTTSGKS